MGNRILVVDDEAIVRAVLRDILLADDRSRTVDEAADGAEGFEKARAGDYDLTLSDIVMPRMDGRELLRALRAERPRMPVVMITAVRDEAKVIECLADGAWDYVTKPFEVAHVVAAVKRALAVSRHLEQRPDDIKIVSKGPGWLELTAASEIEYLHRFRKFTEILLGANLLPAVREDIRLAVEELGRNAIEWGNRYDHDKRVRLSYCLFDDRIVFRVEDEGEGFIPDEVPDPTVDPVALMEQRRRSGKRPGGYGIHIVRKIMDEVKYSEKGNSVVMTKYLH